MPRNSSPLRYPGGKFALRSLLENVLQKNDLQRCRYVEPYAGGAGLALSLLFTGHASEICINDLDLGVWSFWHSVLERTEDLVQLIQQTPIALDEWYRQRKIVEQQSDDVLKLGFATFYLNRTNRSGIIKGAGVIGGYEQTGRYKIDCRFNRAELIERIERIAKYRSRIRLTNLDAVEFMRGEFGGRTFFCIDPPYFANGARLYTSFYNEEDHADVAAAVLELQHPWIVTYDNDPVIQQIYLGQRQFVFDIRYSLAKKRKGIELLVASKDLELPTDGRHQLTAV